MEFAGDYKVQLEVFEGPLDLLLEIYLIALFVARFEYSWLNHLI